MPRSRFVTWWQSNAFIGWVSVVIAAASLGVAVIALRPSGPSGPVSPSHPVETSGQDVRFGAEPIQSTSAQSPHVIDVRFHGTIRLSSGFRAMDLDADPIVPDERGDVIADLVAGWIDAGRLSEWPKGGQPTREDCVDRLTNYPLGRVDVDTGSIACALSDEGRPARLSTVEANLGLGVTWWEVEVTVWEE